jgi:membrane protein
MRSALIRLLKTTFNHWLGDKAPQLGAASVYYTVVFPRANSARALAVFGFIYGNSEVVRQEFLHQVYSTLDPSSGKAVAGIGASTGKPTASALATVVGIAVALFGASGVFGQLQDALNVIWGVKPKPGNSIASFLRARFLSFAMVAGVCSLLLVSLTASAIITAVGGYLTRLQQCPNDDKDRQGRHDARRCHRLTELGQLRLVAGRVQVSRRTCGHPSGRFWSTILAK